MSCATTAAREASLERSQPSTCWNHHSFYRDWSRWNIYSLETIKSPYSGETASVLDTFSKDSMGLFSETVISKLSENMRRGRGLANRNSEFLQEGLEH